MSSEIHVGDIGTEFIVTVKEDDDAVDISSATVKDFILKKPLKTKTTWTSSFYTDGSDGKLSYATTAASDLDQDGTWTLQVDLAITGWTGKTDTTTFEVYKNL